MQEDRFDDKIRELFNGVHEEYDSSSWDILKERLDAPDLPIADEHEFIPVVKEKLNKQRVEVPEEHWHSLKSDLDIIEDRKERLYIVKALEAAIVLLLVYTYFNYQWHTSSVEMNMVYIEQLEKENSDPDLIEASIAMFIPQETSLAKSIEVKEVIEPVKEIATNSIALVASPSWKSKNTAIFENFIPQQDYSSSTSLLRINKLKINALQLDLVSPEPPSTQRNVALVQSDLPSDGWSMGMSFSYDANFINTDINLGYLSNQIESGLGGTSVGVTVGHRKGKYEIETGLRFSEKTFVPGLLTNYAISGNNSFLESQLDHMVIKQMQVPLRGKIYATPYKKATLYGLAGVSLNFIMDNYYAISRTNQSKARLANAPTTDVVDLKNLPHGLVYGGSAQENIYVTGIIGFGIESYMVNGISWYVQPLYQHSFKTEINELVKKINSLSLEAGLKFAF